MLTNTPAQTQLRLEARKSFSLAVLVQLASGAAADLTDHTLHFVMATPLYRGGTVVVNQLLDIIEATEGHARLNLQAGDLDLAEGEYPFSISVLTENDYSALLVKGTVDIQSNTSPLPSGEYSGLGAAASMTLTLQQNNSLTVSVDHLPFPEIVANVKQIQSWQEARVNVSGAYPKQHFEFELPGPAHDVGAPSYANLPPGTVCMIHWNGTVWKIGATTVTARPTARSDVYMHFIDGLGTSTGLPAWALSNDFYDKVT